jgi:nucleoside phosphorylase
VLTLVAGSAAVWPSGCARSARRVLFLRSVEGHQRDLSCCPVASPLAGMLDGRTGGASEDRMNANVRVDVVVLTALPVEYRAVRTHLSALLRQSHHAGTQFEIGTLRSGVGRVAIAEIGEGNAGAAVLTERAITMFEPDTILFVGVGGALRDDIDLGDVVVGTRVYAYHGGKDEGEGFSVRPRAYEASHELEQRARLVARADRWQLGSPKVHFKPIAAGEVVLNSRETPLARQIRRHYNDAAAIEMESAGLAHAGHLNRAFVLTIRGISDRADGHKHVADSAGSQTAAAANAAAFAFDVIDDFLAERKGCRRPSPEDSAAPPSGYVDAGAVAPRAAHGNASVDHTERPKQVAWRVLSRPLEVVWRADTSRRIGMIEQGSLELHLVPADEVERIEVRRLPGLAEGLAAIGRAAGIFSASQALTVESGDRVARACSDDYGNGPTGLAVDRFGQRSAWEVLPHDNLGSVLDQGFLVDRIAKILAMLSGLDLPAPSRYAPTVGIQPATSVTLGHVSKMPRQQATINMSAPPYVRIPAEETLPTDQLGSLTNEVAEELAARLIAAFRQTVR